MTDRLTIDEDSNLIKHARRELRHEDPDTLEKYLQVVQAFANAGHSGTSAFFAHLALTDILALRPLSPLTDDPAEWVHHDETVWGEPGGIWQNQRDSTAFSPDGGKTYWLLGEKEAAGSIYTTPLHTSAPASA